MPTSVFDLARSNGLQACHDRGTVTEGRTAPVTWWSALRSRSGWTDSLDVKCWTCVCRMSPATPRSQTACGDTPRMNPSHRTILPNLPYHECSRKSVISTPHLAWIARSNDLQELVYPIPDPMSRELGRIRSPAPPFSPQCPSLVCGVRDYRATRLFFSRTSGKRCRINPLVLGVFTCRKCVTGRRARRSFRVRNRPPDTP